MSDNSEMYVLRIHEGENHTNIHVKCACGTKVIKRLKSHNVRCKCGRGRLMVDLFNEYSLQKGEEDVTRDVRDTGV